MSFSEVLLNVIRKESTSILLFIFNTATIMLYYYFLYNSQFRIYPLILTSTFLIYYFVYMFFKYKKFYVCLNEVKTSPKYKIKNGCIFEEVFDVLREIHHYYICKISNLEDRYEERDKFLLEWIHNMKTSLSVIELATEKARKQNKSEIIDDIAEENIKIQESLESVLTTFRMKEFNKDFIPERVNLRQMVLNAINDKKRNFIYGNIFPEVEIGNACYVYTDEKWMRYVVCQVIINSIKYAQNTKNITFYCEETEETIVLHIKDEGIGIREDELQRVFDPFFTGSNGRKNVQSSGIGLYMCKTICEMLSSEISIQSKEGNGTIVNIIFHQCKVM